MKIDFNKELEKIKNFDYVKFEKYFLRLITLFSIPPVTFLFIGSLNMTGFLLMTTFNVLVAGVSYFFDVEENPHKNVD